MKILFPLAGTPAGVGSEDYMFEVAQRLAARGHEITLLIPDGRRLPDARFKALYYRPSPPPKPLLWRVWYPIAIAHQIVTVARLPLPAYDAIVTGLLPPLFGISLRNAGIPRVYLVLSPLAWFEILSYGKQTLGLRLGARAYHWLQCWAWRRCEAVVSFTATMTVLRTSFFKRSPRTLVESAPGVDFTRFKPGEPNTSLRTEFGIPAEAPLVISFCRLIESKDIGFLLRAFSRAELPADAHLLILGKGPALDSLRAEVQELRLGTRVHFAGFRDNVEDYLRLGHVYAFPSRLESFGLTLAQAMASGLPAVARHDSYPYVITSSASIIEHGTSGFLIRDEREMAEAIAKLLTDTGLRQQMAAAAARIARERFCWERHIDAIETSLLRFEGR